MTAFCHLWQLRKLSTSLGCWLSMFQTTPCVDWITPWRTQKLRFYPGIFIANWYECRYRFAKPSHGRSFFILRRWIGVRRYFEQILGRVSQDALNKTRRNEPFLCEVDSGPMRWVTNGIQLLTSHMHGSHSNAKMTPSCFWNTYKNSSLGRYDEIFGGLGKNPKLGRFTLFNLKVTKPRLKREGGAKLRGTNVSLFCSADCRKIQAPFDSTNSKHPSAGRRG